MIPLSHFFFWSGLHGLSCTLKKFYSPALFSLVFSALTIKNAALCIVLKEGLLAFQEH